MSGTGTEKRSHVAIKYGDFVWISRSKCNSESTRKHSCIRRELITSSRISATYSTSFAETRDRDFDMDGGQTKPVPRVISIEWLEHFWQCSVDHDGSGGRAALPSISSV